ncbi:MAG TPA: hypothetical protein VJR27_03005 [Candidatus Saccharimonadales bacterium]|nr:hypothetical protein [Candidatus Saccharimonadales bacterium]
MLPGKPTEAATGINQQINYQARLLNSQGAVVADGTYNIQFKIYKNGDGASAGDTTGTPGGTLLWTENWQNNNSQGVTVKNGYFSVQLGAICVLSGGSCQGNSNTGVDFNQSILWLSVNIGGTTSGTPSYDGEMLPMRQMAAAPYALNSNMLGGLTATQFLQLAPSSVQADSSTNSTIFLNKTGSSGFIVELQNSGSDVVTISKTGVINTTAGLSVAGTSVCDTTGTTGCIAKSGSGYYIHNQTGTVAGGTVQASNFAVQGSSNTSPTALLAANNGGSGDILDLQNGSGANVATFSNTGSVLFKPSTNATTAFQVQPSGSTTPVLNVDTTNSRLGLGTSSPSTTLDVAVNNVQVAAPIALIEQAGSGHSSLGFTNPTASFYIGQDANNSDQFSINSSTSASSGVSTAMGNSNTSSVSTDSNPSGYLSGLRVTAGATGTVSSMYVDWRAVEATPNNKFMVALYADNGAGAKPQGTPLATSATTTISLPNGTGANNWNQVFFTSTANVTSGTTYWLVMQTNNASTGNIYGFNGSTGYDAFMSNTYGTWPTSWTLDAGSGSGAPAYLFYSPIVPSSGISDMFGSGSLFTITQSGAVTIKEYSDSTTALRVLNSGSAQNFSVDSTNGRVLIGNGSTGYSSPNLLVLNSGTTSSDPTGIAGAMYYNSNLGRFRCYENGSWRNCITEAQISRYHQSGTAQSISNNTDTKITLNTADNTEAPLTVSGNNTFTTTRAGIWQISANLRFAAGGTSSTEHYLAIADSTEATRYAQASTFPLSTVAGTLSTTATVRLASGATISVFGYQNSGGAVNVDTTWNGTNISLTWVGD